jgi:hypothetical protein
MDGISFNKILDYGKILYETGRYLEAKKIFKNFIKITSEGKKHISKLILCLWKIICVDFIVNDFSETKINFELFIKLVDELKTQNEDELKKNYIDPVK